MLTLEQGQETLFETTSRPFPQTQYLGSKQRLVRWIYENAPSEIETMLDAFSGTSVVAHHFKNRGKRVITNDFLKFNYHIAKALIENDDAILNENDIDLLLRPNPKAQHLMEDVFTDVFFVRHEAQFIDNFRSNIQGLHNEYKQSLAIAVMCRALTRKVTLGHFAHLSALKYSMDKERIKRNRSLARPIRDIFLDLVPLYNNAIFGNGHRHEVHCEDTLSLVEEVKDVDLVYFDPPYCGRHPDYQAFYHLLETFVEYWFHKEFRNGTKSYHPKRHSGFVGKSESLNSMRLLFQKSEHIPFWLVSYNSKSYPDKETLLNLLRQHRTVDVREWHYHEDYGGKGSIKGTIEYLFVCTP